MSYEEFANCIIANVKRELGEGVQIKKHQILKNNDVLLDGLSVVDAEEKIAPTVYLNDYFEDYQQGVPFSDILEMILDVYRYHRIHPPITREFYMDFENVKDGLACKLVNYKKNAELLKQVPHYRYLDLAIVFYYFLRNEAVGRGTILVRDSHVKKWGITKEVLYETARGNTLRLLPYQFHHMREVMEEIAQNSFEEFEALLDFEEDDFGLPMYVLTNTEKTMGSACILYDSVLSQIGESIQADFYVLPSSIHECIIIPRNIPVSIESLKDMVREINLTQVRPEEVLSDEVYVYNCLLHRLSL